MGSGEVGKASVMRDIAGKIEATLKESTAQTFIWSSRVILIQQGGINGCPKSVPWPGGPKEHKGARRFDASSAGTGPWAQQKMYRTRSRNLGCLQGFLHMAGPGFLNQVPTLPFIQSRQNKNHSIQARRGRPMNGMRQTEQDCVVLYHFIEKGP